ncbi:unnamed protein product [Strongylus vulgaris]|uniref:Uncharacterized protein n=1 Tax=Strongylus vulgaris TaxID=40348 RepID=A0A3P7J085_STRVU|nr:unnamed protein product [Strongylus vulgaris]
MFGVKNVELNLLIFFRMLMKDMFRLMIIFIILAAVLLLAILGTLLWLLAKRRKQKPKKAGFLNDASNTSKGGYTALQSQRYGGAGRDSDDRGMLVHEQETYSTPDHLYGGYGNRYSHSDSHRGFPSRRDAGGYGNGLYSGDGSGTGGRDRNGGGVTREIAIRDARRDFSRPSDRDRRDIGGSRLTVSSDGDSMVRHGVHETVEESFKQEITYERPASTDSREML